MGTGKTYSTKYLLDSNNSSGVAGQVLSTTSTGIDWVDANTVPGTGLWLASGNNIYNSNSGNVGIGSGALGNPGGDKLHIDGSLRVGPYFSTSDRDFIKLMPHGSDTRILSPNERFHIENPSGDIIVTPSSAGGVGIGTTSPNYKLTAYGSSTDSEIVASFGSANDQNEYTAIGLSGFIASNGATKAGLALKRTATYGTGELHFLNNNTLDNSDMTLSDSKMMIDSTGNVGIGTTDPQSKLHLATTGGSTLTIQNTTNSGNAALNFRDEGGNDQFQIYYALGANRSYNLVNGNGLTVYSSQSSSEIARFGNASSGYTDSYFTGNVGIKTTSPANPLGINFAPNGISSITTSNNSTAWNTSSAIMLEGASNSNGLGFGVSGTANDRKSWIQSGHPDQQYASNLGTLAINPLGGNVGIGTTSPTSKLQVSGSGNESVEIKVSGGTTAGNTGSISLSRTDGSGSIIQGAAFLSGGVPIGGIAGGVVGSSNTSAPAFAIQTPNSTNGHIVFNPKGTEKMRITSGGNVGIGVTNPGVKLQLISADEQLS